MMSRMASACSSSSVLAIEEVDMSWNMRVCPICSISSDGKSDLTLAIRKPGCSWISGIGATKASKVLVLIMKAVGEDIVDDANGIEEVEQRCLHIPSKHQEFITVHSSSFDLCKPNFLDVPHAQDVSTLSPFPNICLPYMHIPMHFGINWCLLVILVHHMTMFWGDEDVGVMQTWYLSNHLRDRSFGGKNFTQKTRKSQH